MVGRALHWMRVQLAFLSVITGLAAAFGYLVIEPHRTGRVTGLVAAAMLLAGLLRAALPTRAVGLLAVRGRCVDALLYLALGGVILGLDIRLHS